MENNKKQRSFYSILKNIFFLMLILQFAPAMFENIKKYFTKAITPKTLVGRLNIKNMITDSSFYVKQIRRFLNDDDITALFLKIDCPGGTPGASQAVFEEIKLFKEKKPVVVLTENVCASGGYYMAAAANKIVAPASALVGSIGVYLQLPNIKELLDKLNVSFRFVQSGEYKTAGNPLKEIDDKDIEYLQVLSDGSYNEFIKDVADQRKLDISKEKIWANGKVFLAIDGKKLGLIDEIGSESKAEEVLRDLAKIETKIKFISPKRPTGLMRFFIKDEDFDDQDESLSSKTAIFLSNLFYKTYLNLSSKNI